jgi:Na+/H+ antiporter NhaD/arsenite permease-like protein
VVSQYVTRIQTIAAAENTNYQAYISLSLDCTGLLRFLAFWVAAKGGTSGRKLYVYFFLFFFGSGVLVGNVSVGSLALCTAIMSTEHF